LQQNRLRPVYGCRLGALARHVGKVVGYQIPVFLRLPKRMALEQLKLLASPLHVSGVVPMFHIPGITPEAPSLEAATGGERLEKIQVDMKDVKAAYDEITTAGDDKPDMVCIGCPHLTYAEIREIAEYLEGKRVHLDVKLWVGTSYQIRVVANRAGWTGKIESGRPSGDQHLHGPRKSCAYTRSKSNCNELSKVCVLCPGVKVFFSTRDCLEAAISGRWRGDDVHNIEVEGLSQG